MKHSSTENVRNPKLVAAMREMAKNNNEHTRSAMAAALVDSRLLAPVERQTIMTEQSGPSLRIRFEDIVNTRGEKYYLAFTDLDEYAKWNEDETHNNALIMTLEDFGNLLIRNVNDLKGFVINPFGENISISKQLLLSLLQQREAKEHAKKGH